MSHYSQSGEELGQKIINAQQKIKQAKRDMYNMLSDMLDCFNKEHNAGHRFVGNIRLHFILEDIYALDKITDGRGNYERLFQGSILQCKDYFEDNIRK